MDILAFAALTLFILAVLAWADSGDVA